MMTLGCNLSFGSVENLRTGFNESQTSRGQVEAGLGRDHRTRPNRHYRGQQISHGHLDCESSVPHIGAPDYQRKVYDSNFGKRGIEMIQSNQKQQHSEIELTLPFCLMS